MGASHPCTCRIIKGGGDISPPSSTHRLGPGAQVRLPVHRTASYVAHSMVESPRRSQSTRRKVVKQRGSEAYVVCIEISIPDIPKAVQHQIIRTRIDGDCSNEASHALNKSELGGGSHQNAVVERPQLPLYKCVAANMSRDFSRGSVDIVCLSLGSKVLLDFVERDRLVKDAGDTNGGGWG